MEGIGPSIERQDIEISAPGKRGKQLFLMENTWATLYYCHDWTCEWLFYTRDA